MKAVKFLNKPITKKKLSKKEQFQVIELLANLLEGGFTLSESCKFLVQVSRLSKENGQKLLQGFEEGTMLAENFRKMGFSDLIVIQLEFAQVHGDIKGTLRSISNYLFSLQKQKAKLRKIMLYPLILLCFLFSILLLLREFLLPQLMEQTDLAENWYFVLIRQMPSILLLLFGICFLVAIFVYSWLKRKTAIEAYTLLMNFPLIASFIKDYISFSLAQEWGNLFKQGLEMKDVAKLMSRLKTSGFAKEIGVKMNEQALLGISFEEQVKEWRFVHQELAIIIFSGGVKGKLGDELLFYSKLCWMEMLDRAEKKMQYIQPIVFLFVALMILGVYAVIMLPIYNNMGEVLL